MGVVLVHAANRHPPNNPGDTESYRQDRRVQRRTEQVSLLPGTAPDAGHDPHRFTELAALAHVFPLHLGRAGSALGEEGRA